MRFWNMLIRYAGIALGLFIMFLCGGLMLYALMMILESFVAFELISLLLAFLLIMTSLIGINGGFHIFEYFGEKF